MTVIAFPKRCIRAGRLNSDDYRDFPKGLKWTLCVLGYWAVVNFFGLLIIYIVGGCMGWTKWSRY